MEAYLAAALPKDGEMAESMAYALLGGGKRIRPLLLLEAAEACGMEPEQVLPAAAAVEAIHQYSLVHDDLPAMDDDDLRRGRPTLHRKFGEAMAILTGDALLTWAFDQMGSRRLGREIPAERILAAVRILAEKAGESGMIGGQVRDIRGDGSFDPRGVNRLKTGALFAAAASMGAVLGGRPEWEEPLCLFGEELGVQFQAVDDRLDQVLARGESDRAAREATERAKSHLAPLGEGGRGLRAFADALLVRST